MSSFDIRSSNRKRSSLHPNRTLFGRITFVPTLVFNVALEKMSVRQWYSRIDQNVILGALPWKSISQEVRIVDFNCQGSFKSFQVPNEHLSSSIRPFLIFRNHPTTSHPFQILPLRPLLIQTPAANSIARRKGERSWGRYSSAYGRQSMLTSDLRINKFLIILII